MVAMQKLLAALLLALMIGAGFDVSAASSGIVNQSFRVPHATAAVRSFVDKLTELGVNVKDFRNANGTPVRCNGVQDDTTGMQRAINYFGSGNGTVHLPVGDCHTTAPLTIAQHRINIVGQGRYASRISFAPTAAGSAIKVDNGAVTYQFTLRDLAITSADSTYTKSAIEIVDASTYTIERVTIGGSTLLDVDAQGWGGANSVGLHLKGRELGTINDVDIAANRPIVIADNPRAAIDSDHHRLTKLYLIGDTANPLITIATGVNVTNLVIEDFAMVKGTDGVRWNDTTSTQISQNVFIGRGRSEGLAGGWAVNINHNFGLYNLTVADMSTGLDNGWRLWGVHNASLRALFFEGTGSGIDVAGDGIDFASVKLNDSSAGITINSSTKVSGSITQGGNITTFAPQAGAWTPSDNSGASIGFNSNEGRYTKVGPMVYATAFFNVGVNASSANSHLAGFPLRVKNAPYITPPCTVVTDVAGLQFVLDKNAFTGTYYDAAFNRVPNSALSGKYIVLTCVYEAEGG
jgi:hypothetical protein